MRFASIYIEIDRWNKVKWHEGENSINSSLQNCCLMKTLNPAFVILVFFVAVMQTVICIADTRPSVIKAIRLESAVNQIYIKLNQRQEYKIIRLDSKTIMIAFRNTRIIDSLPKLIPGKSIIKGIRPENLPGNAAAIEVSALDDLNDATAFWKGTTLVVKITGDRPRHKTRPKLIKKLNRKDNKKIVAPPEKESDPVEESAPVEAYALPKKKKKPQLLGNLDDLPAAMAKDKCTEIKTVSSALAYCQKAAYNDAYRVINTFFNTNQSETCLETESYLRAYCSFKKNEFEDEAKLLETGILFQDAISYYPESKYTPFGMTALGKIYRILNNDTEAKGYFNLVLQKFKDFSGTPGILFELGMIHVKKEEHRKAISKLEKIVSAYPDVSFISDVRRELGKAFFNANDFSKSLEQMQWFINNKPKMVYKNPDLLLYTGNCYYHIGEHEKAREFLMRAYNLYPEIENNHVILTRIGDIYANEGKDEKAIDIYKLVTDKFPGTDGFVISSMRLTEYVKDQENRKDLYMMIINDHPEHPMANLAQLRLAELQHKTGEYDKSIETINRLLEENPKALKTEAVFLKQKSFEAVFKKLFENNNYPDILIKFEAERMSFNHFENPDLFFYTGKAYYMGHLYKDAAENLDKALKYYPDDKKSAELLYLLGVSLYESDKTKDAAKILQKYVRTYPKGKNASSAFLKIGLCQVFDKKYTDAEISFKKALKQSKSNKEKTDIFLASAKMYEDRKDFRKVIDLLIRTINLLSPASEDHYGTISVAYRKLGHAFMDLGKFDKSADAFAMAIKFVKKDNDSNDLKYLMGTSYQKGNIMVKAEDAFNNVVRAGDPFWSKLAKEKLREIYFAARFD